MKSEEWKTYRTRFLVNAKQLTSTLSFVDHLGRQHCGQKGDYLVESSDGVISIAPRRIFEDIYVPIPRLELRARPTSSRPNSPTQHEISDPHSEGRTTIGATASPRSRLSFTLEHAALGDLNPIPVARVLGIRKSRALAGNPSLRLQRKLPQPTRDSHQSLPVSV